MCNLVFNSDYIVTYYVQQLDCNCMILIKNNLDTTCVCCFCYIYRFLKTSKVKYISENFRCFSNHLLHLLQVRLIHLLLYFVLLLVLHFFHHIKVFKMNICSTIFLCTFEIQFLLISYDVLSILLRNIFKNFIDPCLTKDKIILNTPIFSPYS